jgi:hypothetical protein
MRLLVQDERLPVCGNEFLALGKLGLVSPGNIYLLNQSENRLKNFFDEMVKLPSRYLPGWN